MLGILKVVFAERDPELVRELYRSAIEQIEGSCPKAAKLLEGAEVNALAPAYGAPPQSAWSGSSRSSLPTTRFPVGRRRGII